MVIIRLKEWVRNRFNSSEILALSCGVGSTDLHPHPEDAFKRLEETLFLLGWSLLHVVGSFSWAKPLAPLGEDAGAQPSSREGDLADLRHAGELAKRCRVHPMCVWVHTERCAGLTVAPTALWVLA